METLNVETPLPRRRAFVASGHTAHCHACFHHTTVLCYARAMSRARGS